MDKLLLIDGNAILHRGYHALPPLTNDKGEPVQAVYGFFSMLLNVLIDQKPEYLIISFDRSKPTIRQSMFAGYHANRVEAPVDFAAQSEAVLQILSHMKVHVVYLDGYEADDVIGTVAKSIEKQSNKTEIVILTGDRDLLQLVTPRTRVLMPLVGITKTVLLDEKAVFDKYGVTPSQFIDYKALIGDASDGYPGVTGIGPKTASKLIAQFHTFEHIYQSLEKIPEKTAILLATDAEQAALAKKLATIITDAPVHVTLEDCKCSGFDVQALGEQFIRLGFKSLVPRLKTVFGEQATKGISTDQLELL